MNQLRKLVDAEHELSVRRHCELLTIHWSGLYYKPCGEKPEIIISDQGSQFTSEKWVKYLDNENIQISIDGKGRFIVNIFIEHLWRSVKHDYVYHHPASDGLELY